MTISDTIILIPARLTATRLPRKPLADIGGLPMIVRVLRQAIAAKIGPVVVACDATEIVEVVKQAGGEAIITRFEHASGSDRINEALQKLDPERRYGYVVNVQGDLPLIDPESIRIALTPLADPAVHIATLAAPIHDATARDNPNVVKVVGTQVEEGRLRALYFTRATAPSGEGPLHHHIGLYAYRREALERFVALPPSPLEVRERLEQLRALEDGMRIDVMLVEKAPFGVDTQDDLNAVRKLLARDD